MAGLGVMDDTAAVRGAPFGTGRGQLYGMAQGQSPRSYGLGQTYARSQQAQSNQAQKQDDHHLQEQQKQQQQQHSGQRGLSTTWPISSRQFSNSGGNSAIGGSTLRPAASVFSPQSYSAGAQPPHLHLQHAQHAPSQDARQAGKGMDAGRTSGNTGPIDREPEYQRTDTYAAGYGFRGQLW
jgi:hypothetical protein